MQRKIMIKRTFSEWSHRLRWLWVHLRAMSESSTFIHLKCFHYFRRLYYHAAMLIACVINVSLSISYAQELPGLGLTLEAVEDKQQSRTQGQYWSGISGSVFESKVFVTCDGELELMGWSWAHLRHVHRTHLNTLKYHLDAVNHRKAHAACLSKRSGETSRHMASKATWWVMCARERAEETAEGPRCYCLTQYQHSPDEWPRMCPDVRTGPRWCRSGARVAMNHSHTLTPGPSCCFMASPATIEGWQPHSVAGRGRKEETEGRGGGGDVVSERIEEEEEGVEGLSVGWEGEKRWKTNSEAGPERS